MSQDDVAWFIPREQRPVDAPRVPLRFTAAFLESISAGWMIRQWDWRRERFRPELHS